MGKVSPEPNKPTKAVAQKEKKEALEVPELAKTLQQWEAAKTRMQESAKEIAKYRTDVGKSMDGHEVDDVKAGGFQVGRSEITRRTIKQQNCPAEIWEKYATERKYRNIFKHRRL